MLILFQRGEVIDTEISYTIQIFGDLVATLFSPEFIYENQVAVWEWKTGRLLLNVFGEDLDSFSLLSQQHIIFALCDDHGDPMLLAANLAKETSDCQEFCKVKSGKYFRYPALGEDSYLHSLQLRADPGPLCGENQNVPFYQDTKDFILILNMWVTEDEIAKHWIHFIPSQLLLSLIESESRVASDWWLSRDTRMYLARDQNDTHVWVCYVFGTRFVTSAYPLTRASGKGEMTIALYDFNRLALRRGAQTSAASDMPGSVVSLSNQIHSGHPFCEDAETSLPYWTNVAYVDAGKNYDGHCTMMCCEDNIVIVDLESRMYRVLVF
ncbi:hypothetical protein BDN70DRAFT_671647 [Pholiota conissans]|uniref:Uncharacterized protein n=1 Tax=Pholiota conissans TaxID=109636 RepID=A0A9P6D0U8_9AGAR|nr:hypothetical protein BDN70DRAFT_671647 [Pholiota conissans]